LTAIKHTHSLTTQTFLYLFM